MARTCSHRRACRFKWRVPRLPWRTGNEYWVFDGYHNRKTRDAVIKDVDKVGGRGDISALFHILDNSETWHEDRTGFESA